MATDQGHRPGLRRIRDLVAVYASTFGVGLVFGFQPPLIALVLAQRGASSLAIGAVTSASTFAVMASSPLYPRLLARLGLRAGVALGTSSCALLMLGMAAFTNMGAWVVLRTGIGWALGLEWIASEVWLNRLSSDATRGRVLAVYSTVFAAGVMTGPLLLQWTGTAGSRPFVIGAACLAATLLPLSLARRVPEPEGELQPLDVAGLVSGAPIIVLAAFIAGLVESADISLLPVYALLRGLHEHEALMTVTAFLAGNVALQLPIGWISDHIGRTRTLACCAVASVLGPPLLAACLDLPVWRWPVLLIWGGTLYGFYTQGIALLGERFAPAQLAAANTAFVVVYCAGGITGPLLGGLAMDLGRPPGLIGFLSASAALLLGGLWLARPRPAQGAQSSS